MKYKLGDEVYVKIDEINSKIKAKIVYLSDSTLILIQFLEDVPFGHKGNTYNTNRFLPPRIRRKDIYWYIIERDIIGYINKKPLTFKRFFAEK